MGKVFLVGAGPGAPDLLTVRALRLLQQADVVLHDALVSAEILALIPPMAHIVDIGKRCGTKLLTQEEINSLLVKYAREYAAVVRLKGGDPGIFGRAGEEIDALVEAGIAYEIIPGVTSALAAAAAAGVSLTDRRSAPSVLFTTAHRNPEAAPVAWRELVAARATLAIYMPAQGYTALSEELQLAGLDAATPCTVVSHAGRSTQQVLATDLRGLSASKALPAPALLLVGECVRPLRAADAEKEVREFLSEGSPEPATIHSMTGVN